MRIDFKRLHEIYPANVYMDIMGEIFFSLKNTNLGELGRWQWHVHINELSIEFNLKY